MEESPRKELRISLRRVGEEARLLVRDSGCGISREAMERIFEPFYTTKGSQRGTGLGLSVVRNVIHFVQGRIEVRSEPGEGTEFQLYFPILKEREKELLRIHIRNIALVGQTAGLPGRAEGKYKLRKWQNPTAFLHELERNPRLCDSVISSYLLEGMNGIELLEMVKNRNPSIRRILLMQEPGKDMEWYLENQIVDRILSAEEWERVSELL